MTKVIELHIHQSLIGKTCRLLPDSVEICRALGNQTMASRAEKILNQQKHWGWKLIFLPEPPYRKYNRWLYCVRLVECDMSWFWFPLECFIVCSAE